MSDICHQSSVIGHQSDDIKHLSSVISHKSSVISHQSSVIRQLSSGMTYPCPPAALPISTCRALFPWLSGDGAAPPSLARRNISTQSVPPEECAAGIARHSAIVHPRTCSHEVADQALRHLRSNFSGPKTRKVLHMTHPVLFM